MRLIGLIVAVIVLAVAIWLVLVNPRLGEPTSAPAVPPPPSSAVVVDRNRIVDDEAKRADAEARAKAAKARAQALAAQRAAEAAQADAIEQNMTPAQNRLNEDYAAQVGDTRPTSNQAANASTASPEPNRP